jgi:aminopeptidase N
MFRMSSDAQGRGRHGHRDDPVGGRLNGCTHRLALFLAGLLLAPGLALAASASPAHVALPDDVTPDAYRLDITPDAAADRFDGTLEVDVVVHRATRRIVLNAAEMTLSRATLDADPSTAAVKLDADDETATLTWPRAIAPGRHVLHVAYRGHVREQATGLFALREPASTSAPASVPAASRFPMLFTQFENSDARRFLPCWDEPARKATFTLSATIPAGLMAVGNMPVAADEPLPDGRRHVRFATTPRMSSYLLFFALGDFERVHRDVHGVDVGVVVRRGDTAKAAFALDAATQILPWLEDWFGTRYPLPKLDVVSAPGSNPGFGAMENWGAIMSFEHYLLFDPAVSTESDRRTIFETLAHEIAHQWFGNLVTMAWWDDLWLNEGFATWMEGKASQALHPEWNEAIAGAIHRERAMRVDQRTGTHPVIVPVHDVLQADAEWDVITYGKGMAVVRELESAVGEGVFRDGVRAYLRAHAYGNTTADDFFFALDAAAGRKVSPIAHDLTRQAGVPLIVEERSRCVAAAADGAGEHLVVTLSQHRYRADAPGTVPARDDTATTWRVPVTLQVPGHDRVTALVAGPAPQDVTVPGCGAVLLNAGEAGYYRTLYTPEGRRALLDALPTLPAESQLGLLQDAGSLALGGRVPMADWLELLARLPVDTDPAVLRAVVVDLLDLERLARGTAAAPALRAFALARLHGMLARAGDATGELALLRDDALSAASVFDDPAIVQEARARFARFLADPSDLDAATRGNTLDVVALHATPAEWDALHRLALAAASHLERVNLYELLGSAERPELADRALALALSGEVPATLVPDLFADVAVRHPAQAFDTVARHWPQLAVHFDTAGSSVIVPHLLDTADRVEDVTRLEAFARAHVPTGARQEVTKVESAIRAAAWARRDRVPELQAWLARQATTPASAGPASREPRAALPLQ